MWECGLDKCQGLDGFSFQFYRSFWDLLQEDFVNLFADFHKNSKLVRGLNSSFITLILKCLNPTAIEEFRPIFLISGVYKVVAKVLSKWLAKVLSRVIAPNQSAFIGDRNILDGVVVTNEIVDEVRKQKKKRNRFCSI